VHKASHFEWVLRVYSIPRPNQYMGGGVTEKGAKIKAGAVRSNALVEAWHLRQERPRKGPASQKPANHK